MMNRYGRMLLVLLVLALPELARADELMCASTGFNLNIASGSKSFRCGLVVVTRGSGTLTFDGTSTVTSSGAFATIITPDAVPVADDTSFKTTGLRILLSGRVYYLRVSAKASNSSITVLEADVSPGLSGAVTEWSYWNTTCRRSSFGYTDFTDSSLFLGSTGLWTSPGALRGADFESFNGTVAGLCYQHGTGAGFPQMGLTQRPQGWNNVIASAAPVDYTNGSCQIIARNAKIGAPNGGSPRGQEFQWVTQSVTTDNWPVWCVRVAK